MAIFHCSQFIKCGGFLLGIIGTHNKCMIYIIAAHKQVMWYIYIIYDYHFKI